MTDSSTKSQKPAEISHVETPSTSSSGSQPPQAPANNTLPEGFTPWEGSSMAVRQGRHWSSTLIWISAAIFGGAMIWAFNAKVDQTITVVGRLEPQGSVEEVDAPATGVVSRVFVKDGQNVTAGTPLVAIEAKGLTSRRQAVETTIELLRAQNTSLQRILASGGTSDAMPPIAPLPTGIESSLRDKLATAVEQTRQISSRLRQIDERISSKTKTLQLTERIADDLRPLYENGGYARVQYLQQLNAIQEQQAELATLREERSSTLGSVAGQINANNRDLEQLQSELIRLREELSYRLIKAPIDGKVFDIQATPSALLPADQVVLKLVPESRLVANVNITNRDIGFVKTGLPVSVGVDSFAPGEFGYIQGTLVSIGSDALPPDQENPYYRFPATVELKQQTVESGGKRLNLQSGMSVSANIRLRSRPVINIISDMFTKQLEGVKRFR